MAREFKEKAHLNTDLKKYSDNYDRIFGKNKESLKLPKQDENCQNCHEWALKYDIDMKDQDELLAQLKEAENVIDFYADHSNWEYSELVSEEGNNGECVFHTGIKESDIRFELGGKRAREYKEKYNNAD